LRDDNVKKLKERLSTAEAIEAAMGEHYVKAGETYAEARTAVYKIRQDIQKLSEVKRTKNSLRSKA
jgi:hypothetical protein